MTDEATIAIEETSVATPRRRLTIDLLTSYALSLARVGAWAIVSSVIVRRAGLDVLAIVALIRGTLNLLTSLPSALAPTLVRGYLASVVVPTAVIAERESIAVEGALAYESKPPPMTRLLDADAGRLTAMLAAAFLCVCGLAYANHLPLVHGHFATASIVEAAAGLAILIVLAGVVRLLGEPAGARLQACGMLSIENGALLCGEALWAIGVATTDLPANANALRSVGGALLAGQLATLLIRLAFDPARRLPFLFTSGLRTTLAAVATLYLGSLADYLYGSSNQILIDRELGRSALAAYVPCLQIDGALLLIVSGLGVALFPRLALHARNDDRAAIRRDYLVGTGASLAMLAAAAFGAWIAAPWAIARWLGTVPAGTLAVLPFVLIHTVLGGTAGVGRAVLLGMGRFKAYTISALVGGLANVGLAILFVVGFGWGLRSVAIATIVAVAGRCAIWMPWYVLRALR